MHKMQTSKDAQNVSSKDICQLLSLTKINVSWRPYSMATRRLPFQWLLPRRVGEGATRPPGLLHFTLDPFLIMLSIKQGGIKYHFWVFSMTRPGIEPRSPGLLANTQLIRPMTRDKINVANRNIHRLIWFWLGSIKILPEHDQCQSPHHETHLSNKPTTFPIKPLNSDSKVKPWP